MIRNGFVNDGLVPFLMQPTFDGFMQLEKLYFSTFKRNIENRVLNISINIDHSTFKYYHEVLKIIGGQHHVRVLL